MKKLGLEAGVSFHGAIRDRPCSPDLPLSSGSGPLSVFFGVPEETFVIIKTSSTLTRREYLLPSCAQLTGSQIVRGVQKLLSGSEIELFAVKNDGLQMTRPDPMAQLDIPFAHGELAVQRNVPTGITVALARKEEKAIRPNGVVFQMSAYMPIVLDGTNWELKEMIERLCQCQVTQIFAQRTDERTSAQGNVGLQTHAAYARSLRD
jgi:hypothetical protein